MYGVSKLTATENVMLVSISGVKPSAMSETLETLASAGVVVDMISQNAPHGSNIHFGFTASFAHFNTVLKTIGNITHQQQAAPMISSGYSKLNLFGEDMIESVGVAARALSALRQADIDIFMLTTSDLDISILVRSEDEGSATQVLCKTFEI